MSSPTDSGQPPTASQRALLVEREGALRDERPVIHALHALDGGDAVEIVPFLRRRDEACAAVADQHRARHRHGIGRIGQVPLDDFFEAVGTKPAVAVDRADEFVARDRKAAVEDRRLATVLLEIDQPHIDIFGQSQLASCEMKFGHGPVLRTVV